MPAALAAPGAGEKLAEALAPDRDAEAYRMAADFIEGRDEIMAKLKRDHGVSLPRPWRDVGMGARLSQRSRSGS